MCQTTPSSPGCLRGKSDGWAGLESGSWPRLPAAGGAPGATSYTPRQEVSCAQTRLESKDLGSLKGIMIYNCHCRFVRLSAARAVAELWFLPETAGCL